MRTSARLGRRSVCFVTLYHPCYAHRNRYDGDYEALRAELGTAGERTQGGSET